MNSGLKELIKYLLEPPDNLMIEPDCINREPTPPSEVISLPKESLMIGTSYPPQLGENDKIPRRRLCGKDVAKCP